jgi:hypothetical protein
MQKFIQNNYCLQADTQNITLNVLSPCKCMCRTTQEIFVGFKYISTSIPTIMFVELKHMCRRSKRILVSLCKRMRRNKHAIFVWSMCESSLGTFVSVCQCMIRSLYKKFVSVCKPISRR